MLLLEPNTLLSPGAPRMNKCSPQICRETRSFCETTLRLRAPSSGTTWAPTLPSAHLCLLLYVAPQPCRCGGLGLPGTSWAPSVSIPLWRRLCTCSPAPKPLGPMVTSHCHAARFLLFAFSHHVRTWTSHGICFSHVPFVLPKEFSGNPLTTTMDSLLAY